VLTSEVKSEIREPLVPGIISDSGAGSSPVNTSLENGRSTGVAVNSDPSLFDKLALVSYYQLGISYGARSGGGWGRSNEGSSNRGETSGDENGTGPVTRELNISLVGSESSNAVLELLVGVSLTSESTGSAGGGTWGSDSSTRKQESGGNGRKLHVD